ERQKKQPLQNNFNDNVFEQIEVTSIVEEQANTNIGTEPSEKAVRVSDNKIRQYISGSLAFLESHQILG
ncbi:8818_t:CDS:1, partial [Racocetra fulgida]